MTQSIRSRSARPVRLILVALIAVGAASCGGGGGGSEPTAGAVAQEPTGATPSTFPSVASFISFLGGLAQSDSTEPLATDAGPPPTSDTDEPTGIS